MSHKSSIQKLSALPADLLPNISISVERALETVVETKTKLIFSIMKLTRKGFLEFRFQDTAKVNSKAVATCDNYRSSRAGGVVRTSRARFDQIILIAKQKIISAISQISFCGILALRAEIIIARMQTQQRKNIKSTINFSEYRLRD